MACYSPAYVSRWVKAGFAAVLLCGGVALPYAARADEITGAGSSFAAPLYQAWSAAAPSGVDVRVNYQTIGSGAGQNQILAGTVDFGASDAQWVMRVWWLAGWCRCPQLLAVWW